MKMNEHAMRGFCNLVIYAIGVSGLRQQFQAGDMFEIRSTEKKSELILIDLDGKEKTLMKVEVD